MIVPDNVTEQTSNAILACSKDHKVKWHFGLYHARSAIAEWADDYNNFQPHASLGYQTPTDYAGIIAVTGSNTTQYGGFSFPPVAPTTSFGLSKTAETLIHPE